MIHEKLTWSEGVHQIYETDPLNYEPELEGAINFYREDHREMVKDAVSSAMEKGEAFEYEAAFISAKGNEKWVRAMGQAEIANGKCIRLYGSFQDITQLKEAEHRLLAITNDLPGVTFQYYLYPDGTDKMQSVSQKSQAIWNLTPDECEKHSQLIWDQIKREGIMKRWCKKSKTLLKHFNSGIADGDILCPMVKSVGTKAMVHLINWPMVPFSSTRWSLI